MVGKATPDRGGPRKSPMQLPVEFQTVETRCGGEDHTRPRGPSESPDGVDPNIRRTRHNVTVITVGSKYEVYVRSPASSHMQTLKQPFQTLAIKWQVNIIEKKSSASSLMRRLSLCQYLPSICMCISAWISKWQCNTWRDKAKSNINHIYPTPPLGQDMTQGQFLSGV